MRNFALFLPFLVASPFYAQAGGGHDGGGNTVNFKLVESYRRQKEEICGYDSFHRDLDHLRQQVPTLAMMIEARLQDTRWYELPVKIRELPEVDTGLRFPSDQMGYQLPHGKEIFLNEEQIETNCKSGEFWDEEEAGRKLMKEIVESLRDDKDTTAGRNVTDEIYPNGTVVQENERRKKGQKVVHVPEDPKKIQRALAENGFGPYLTGNQYAALAGHIKADYLANMSTALDRASTECKAGAGIPNVLRGLQNPNFKPGARVGLDDQYLYEKWTNLDGASETPEANRSRWKNPFLWKGATTPVAPELFANYRLRVACGAGMKDLPGETLRPKDFMELEACREIYVNSKEYFDLKNPANKASESVKEGELKRHAAALAYDAFNEKNQSMLVEPIEEELAKSAAFLTIMASGLTKHLDSEKYAQPLPKKMAARLASLVGKAEQVREQTEKLHGTQRKRDELCRAVDTLGEDVKARVKKAEAEIELADYGPKGKGADDSSEDEFNSPLFVVPGK